MPQLSWEDLFVREIKQQCEYVAIAANDANTALKNHKLRRFWFAVQAFAGSAANLSKLLWNDEYGDGLRTMLQVTEDSPLRSRSFRNHIEHFDERLVTWIRQSHPSSFADGCVGPTGFLGGLDQQHFFRNYESETHMLWFRGEGTAVLPIIEAAAALQRRISELRPVNGIRDSHPISEHEIRP